MKFCDSILIVGFIESRGTSDESRKKRAWRNWQTRKV